MRLLLACLLFPVFASARPVLVLDPGHTTQNGGALGVSGRYEVEYNDRFTNELKQVLENSGWQVFITRGSTQEITLAGRSAFAKSKNADLFLSIHHDSAQLQYLQKAKRNGKVVHRTIKPIRGYSLFVSADNPHYRKSFELASSISSEILKLGRPPTLHHAEPIQGEHRELLDKKMGIYRYDGLAVLRQTIMPAVLLEIGVIVDEDDEAYVSRLENRQAIAAAISRALETYKRELKY